MRNEFPQPFGPYELLRRLGSGGMAEVFLAQAATHHGEKRLVALKRMHMQLSEDPSAVEMLVQEAKLAMRFDHPNIARTFELGCHGDVYYFIMEYVDGIDLGTVARLCEDDGSQLDPVVCAYVVSRMARGLAHAHDLCDDDGKLLGVVHRDVSPQNVLISRHGGVKLIDFGVAKVASRIQQTMAGIIKGKYAYMSPEQASAETVDARSDVFSMGICLYELLSGKPLFRSAGNASPFAILRAVRDDPIVALGTLVPGLPPELTRIAHKALERDRDKRFQAARLLADELDAWLAQVAPDFGDHRLATYVQRRVEAAPAGALPQNAIATPPIAKMGLEEFAPSPLSVVVASPLLRAAPPAPVRPAGVPRAAAFQTAPMAAQPERAAKVPLSGLWPSRRAAVQFLWVGVVALIFALGWSTIATLVRMGRL